MLSRDRRYVYIVYCEIILIISNLCKLLINAIVPLIVSSKNNWYVIIATCLDSKYPDAVPIENLSSKTVIYALKQNAKVGYQREIECDQGTCFTRELTTAILRKYGINHSSVCHPQPNTVERLHSTLKRILKALCLQSKGDWKENLPMALFPITAISH